MAQVDPSYYGTQLYKSDPHFCTVCQTRGDQNASLLNINNYSAWTNYGMCSICLEHYLGFQNGLIFNEDRRFKLIKFLKDNDKVRARMNPHLRLYLFPKQRALYQRQQKEKKQRQLRIGFKDTGTLRCCVRCGYTFILTQHTQQRDKCFKCDHPFNLPPFQWQGISQEEENG